MIKSINEELNKMDIYNDKQCVICGRKYPKTVLNIDGVIHHRENYKCIDLKSCKKAKRKNK